jgi:hypothetical protein
MELCKAKSQAKGGAKRKPNWAAAAHLLDVSLREVEHLVADLGHRDKRPGARAPQLREERILPSSATACEPKAQQQPANARQNPLKPKPARAGQKHDTTPLTPRRRGSFRRAAARRGSSCRCRRHPGQIFTSAPLPGARSPPGPLKPGPNHANFWSDSPSAFKFPSDSPLLLQLIPLSSLSLFFLFFTGGFKKTTSVGEVVGEVFVCAL